VGIADLNTVYLSFVIFLVVLIVILFIVRFAKKGKTSSIISENAPKNDLKVTKLEKESNK